MNRTAYDAPRCPGSLSENYTTYSPAVLRNVFNGKQVFHVLDKFFPKTEWKAAQLPGAKYGGQLWFGMKLIRNKLIPDVGGEFILKTVVPGGSQFRFSMEQAGNEHICSQLASQVFALPVSLNAMIFFRNAQPAILQRKFSDGDAYMSFESMNANSRRITSFIEIASQIDNVCAASLIVKEQFFSQVIFWWLVANGMDYTKNAGLIKTIRGDYVMAPLHQALCTRIHELTPAMHMKNGLFPGDKNTPEFHENGHYTRNEFTSFGIRIGLRPERITKILNRFVEAKIKAEQLIEKSFLPPEAKAVLRFNVVENLLRLR